MVLRKWGRLIVCCWKQLVRGADTERHRLSVVRQLGPELKALARSLVFERPFAERIARLLYGVWSLFCDLQRRQQHGLPYARATLHMMGFAAIGLAAIMAVYYIGDAAGLSDLEIAILEHLMGVN